MTIVRRFVAPLGAIACLVCTGASASPDCSSAPVLTPLQRRIAASAAEGTDALRRFVAMRQLIHKFDVHATMEQGARHREWLALCGRAAGDGVPVMTAVEKTDE
jgi:hypothetical protein